MLSAHENQGFILITQRPRGIARHRTHSELLRTIPRDPCPFEDKEQPNYEISSDIPKWTSIDQVVVAVRVKLQKLRNQKALMSGFKLNPKQNQARTLARARSCATSGTKVIMR